MSLQVSTGQVSLPVSMIDPGNNPRRYFDPAKMAELEESIRTRNLLQPILVRPVDGRYQIVAGERRFRAYTAVFGTDDSVQIPSVVREMSDQDAAIDALLENMIRADMNPAEEAEAAARIVAAAAGDREEAAKRLGWNRAKLDARLGLMTASDSVRNALVEGKIKLGHAELLATIRKELQEKILPTLLEKGTSVAELRATIEAAVLSLEAAIFDKTECGSCPSNTGNQQALFAECLSGGNCTNGACYKKKTEEELQKRADALREEFQVIRIVRPGDNMTLVPLRADGDTGVGEEQAKACRTCKDFGGAVSAVPDKLGKSYKNICFNTVCNTQMVGKRIAAEKAAAKAALAEQAGALSQDAASPKSAAKPASAPAASTAATPAAKPASSEPSTRVKEYREGIWRAALSAHIAALPLQHSRAVLVGILATSSSRIESTAFQGGHPKFSSGDLAGNVKTAIALEKDPLGALLAQLPAQLSKTHNSLTDIVRLMKVLGVDIAAHWKLNEDFLNVLTKNEIEAIADELGIGKAMGDAFAKARNGGKAEFIKAVLTVKGFEYAGKVPRLMVPTTK